MDLLFSWRKLVCLMVKRMHCAVLVAYHFQTACGDVVGVWLFVTGSYCVKT